jgi:hypothetical protein
MIKIKKYKFPILFSALSLAILLTFQHCGKAGGAGDSLGGANSPLSISTKFAPDGYFVAYKNYGGSNDLVIVGFDLKSDNKLTSYMVRFINGNYSVGYYRYSEGTYQFTQENKATVITTKDTCNDLKPQEYMISGIAGDTIYLTKDTTSIKFFSEKSWRLETDFKKENTALVEDTQCNKF